MRITTWGEYGLIVSLGLARREGEGPVAARELAEHERLPHDYVEQILLRLRRAGLVESVRGAKGGYHLARPAHAITVKDVMVTSTPMAGVITLSMKGANTPATAASAKPIANAIAETRCTLIPVLTASSRCTITARVR